jgi:site-specific recombinase XerD
MSKLSEVAANYVAHKQSMGMRFRTEACTLKSFCRAMGEVTLHEVTPNLVVAWLAGTGPVTRFWHRKYEVLTGFYRFAIARGYATCSPLPQAVPKPLKAFVPYIYSREELRRLLNAIDANDHPRSSIGPDTYRTLLLLLYGVGLRISEALALTMEDVNLTEAVLRIRKSKFYKTRLVPIGTDLLHILVQHARKRRRDGCGPDAPFFVSRNGGPVTRQAAEITFCRLRIRAGVLRDDGRSRHQPRLHDLRHAFAVHRLVSWYRSGVDVQRLLPRLSTYLGHVHIAATQRYLTLTPELLREASARFERYAMEAAHA